MIHPENWLLITSIFLIFAAVEKFQSKKKIKKLEDDLKDYKDFFLNNSVNCLNYINEDITVSYVKHDDTICRYVSGSQKRSILAFETYAEVARVIEDNKGAVKK